MKRADRKPTAAAVTVTPEAKHESHLWCIAASALEQAAELARKIEAHYEAGGSDLDRNLYLAVLSMPGLTENAREAVRRVSGGGDDKEELAGAAARALYEWEPGKQPKPRA